jgi:hypothetical protein
MYYRPVVRFAFVPLILAVAVVACGPPERGTPDGPPPGPDADLSDAPLPPFMGDVYAHSYQKLYKVDPDTLEVALIGTFDWPGGPETELMTDIAVDREGRITGITFGGVWSIDKDTASVTYLGPLTGQEFNGLTFLPQPDDTEILVGVGLSGTLWQIDPTGAVEPVQIGAYGGTITSSGDIVSVTGFGTVATVKQGSEYDYLARIDENTGIATILGPTGYADIWGVGYWRNKVFGFVATNQFVLIDVLTGAATYISTGPENWAGAGVTTRAPIEP